MMKIWCSVMVGCYDNIGFEKIEKKPFGIFLRDFLSNTIDFTYFTTTATTLSGCLSVFHYLSVSEFRKCSFILCNT